MYDNNSIPDGSTEDHYNSVYGSSSSAGSNGSNSSTSSGTTQNTSATSQSGQDYGSSSSMEDGSVKTSNADGSTTTSTRVDGWSGSQEDYKTEGGSDGTTTDTTVYYTGNYAHNSGTSFVSQNESGPNGSTSVKDNNDGTTTDTTEDPNGNVTSTDHPRNETTSADTTPAHNGTPDNDPNGQCTEPSKGSAADGDGNGGNNASPNNPAPGQAPDGSNGSGNGSGGDGSAGATSGDGSGTGASGDQSEAGDFLDESSKNSKGVGSPQPNENGSAGSTDPGANDDETSRHGVSGVIAAPGSGNADPTNSDDGTPSRAKDAGSLTSNFNGAAGAIDHGANGDDPVPSGLHSPIGQANPPFVGHGPGGQELGAPDHLSGSLLGGAAAHESGPFAELIRAAHAPLQSGLIGATQEAGSEVHAAAHLALAGGVGGHDLGSADAHIAAVSPALVGVHEVHFDQHAIAAPMLDHAAQIAHH